jgi:predicted Zn-dependent protease
MESNKKFNASYFDGHSSGIFHVTAEIVPGCIKLYHENEMIIWQVDKINTSESYFNKHNSLIKYGEQFPYATLELNDTDFRETFKQCNPHIKLKNDDIKFFQGLSNKSIFGIALGCLLLIVLSYFYFIPSLAEFVAGRFPVAYEIQLGQNIYNQMKEDFDIDEQKTALANDFFNELKIKSNYPIHITVVNAPIKNAFALPGGNIVVYDEILQKMNSEEEFAALLCHEYSHISFKHTTRSLFRNLGTYVILSIVLSDINGIMGVLIENAHTIKSLSYTRALEEEADRNGLKLLIASGVNPYGMVNLFKHLKEKNQGSIDMPEFLSSHPLLDERIKYIENEYRNKSKSYPKNDRLASIWKKI